MTILNIPTAPAVPDLTNGEPPPSDSGSPASTSAGGTTGTAPAGGLQGRDPDLIFEGEKIMVNGKEYVVQKGDTLSGIAVKLGLANKGNQKEIFDAVVKLATENGMDLKKMDQEGFGGRTAERLRRCQRTEPLRRTTLRAALPLVQANPVEPTTRH
jgi:LysM domain